MNGLPLLAVTGDPLDWEDATMQELEELCNLHVAVSNGKDRMEPGVIVRYDEGCRMHLIEFDRDSLEDRWHNLAIHKWKVITEEDKPEPEKQLVRRCSNLHPNSGVPKKRARQEHSWQFPGTGGGRSSTLSKVLTSSCINPSRGQCFITTNKRVLGLLFPSVSLSELPLEVCVETVTDSTRRFRPVLREYSTGYFFCGNGWRDIIGRCRLSLGDSFTIQPSQQDSAVLRFTVQRKSTGRSSVKPAAKVGQESSIFSANPSSEQLTCAICSKMFVTMASLRSHKRWCDSQSSRQAETARSSSTMRKGDSKQQAKVECKRLEEEQVDHKTVFVTKCWNECYLCSGAGGLICCNSCAHMFHPACENLSLSQKPWVCGVCTGSSSQQASHPQLMRGNYNKLEQTRFSPDERLQGMYMLTHLLKS
eukprot:TRINITY_DN28959_c0_g1_i1.p1 TRINITY_DN28959_c0_g1~~TRINITY_DN28959_c0_g1_i1.p1  ORF type:complete len:420 (-),score=55.98 TRINITY_DN28959_c0_g1_i1:435-1694(-)